MKPNLRDKSTLPEPMKVVMLSGTHLWGPWSCLGYLKPYKGKPYKNAPFARFVDMDEFPIRDVEEWTEVDHD